MLSDAMANAGAPRSIRFQCSLVGAKAAAEGIVPASAKDRGGLGCPYCGKAYGSRQAKATHVAKAHGALHKAARQMSRDRVAFYRAVSSARGAIAVVDLEVATWTAPRCTPNLGEIVSLAVIKVGAGGTWRTYYQCFRPRNAIDERCRRLHGLGLEQLKGMPAFSAKAAAEIQGYLSGAAIWSWNARFDQQQF
jgi:uncharacterized C2H2 Zn-finger protein